MSSRARRVTAALRAERFDWGAGQEPDDTLPQMPPPVVEAQLPADAPADVTPAEHQARLAGLEREAFAKGYAQGERAGLEAGAKRTEAMLRRIAQTLEELGRLRKAIIRDTERQMVQLALALARRLVHREVSMDPTLVAAMAHVALERLGDAAPATIKLHPDDFAVISGQRGTAWEGAQVTILPDPAVTRGGCVVESDFGTVDGQIDAQFEQMSRALLDDAGVIGPAEPLHAA
jgi:flagellar assembly protein FliH